MAGGVSIYRTAHIVLIVGIYALVFVLGQKQCRELLAEGHSGLGGVMFARFAIS